MKKLSILVFAILLTTASCSPYQQPYQYIQSPTGQQMVVVNDGTTQFLMDVLLFQSLMGSGGYGGVVNYYHSHTNVLPIYNQSTYGRWKPYKGTDYNVPKSAFRSNGSSSAPVFNNTSPKSNGFRATPGSSAPVFRSTPPISSGFRSGSSGGFRSGSSGGFRSGRR